MNRNELAVKGSVIGIASQLITLLFKFLVRTFIIRYLGSEILGLDSILLDVVSMLSLAELGITSAMLYRMYKPIVENNYKRIDLLMASYRIVYRVIAFGVASIGVIISFFLPFIITNVELSYKFIYFAFYLQLINSVSSYLLSYQRILLNADQKRHFCIVVDTIAIVICSILKVAVLLLTRSYHVYIGLTILQTVTTNLYLRIYCKKNYAYVKNDTKADAKDIKTLLLDTKDVLGGKLAGYIYSGTDNMIISIALGTGIVGLLSNYKYIIVALKSLVNSAMATIQPLIGNYLNSSISKESAYRTLMRYTFIRYVIAGGTVAPFVVLADLFVGIWTGNISYNMPIQITIFLAIDYYIGCIYGPLGEYAAGMGMFKWTKYAQYAGAISNLVLSLIGVMVWGCEGVLLATVISQVILWIGMTYIIFIKYLKSGRLYGIKYLITHMVYMLIVSLAVIISKAVIVHLGLENQYVKFILGGVITIVVFVALVSALLFHTEEFKFAVALVKKLLNYRKNPTTTH